MSAAVEIDLTKEYALAALPMPYTLRLPEPISDELLLAVSRRNRDHQIERNAWGELEIMSPAGLQGDHFEVIICAQLVVWAEEHGGMAFGANAGFTLPDTSVRSPDAGWLSQENWDALSEKDQVGFGRVCPAFLIELLSRTDSRRVLQANMEMWIASGARLAWMIDPFARTVSVYQPGAEVEVLHEPG